MKLDKCIRRDRKRDRRRTGMKIDGKSVFILEEEKKKKSDAIKRKREEEFKEDRLEYSIHIIEERKG